MTKAVDLIDKFQYALDHRYGYIWGTAGILWTQTAQDQKVNHMVSKYGVGWKNDDAARKDNNYYAALYGQQWVGHYVADCSGLFTWAFKQLGGTMYHGSNTMYRKWCAANGKLKDGKRSDGKELKPGTAVFTYNAAKDNYGHVGLYIGGGYVIEAQGTKAGVVKSKVTLAKWVAWGELKGVAYGGNVQPEPAPEPQPEPAPAKGYAVVTGKSVALREGPGTDARVLTRVATGKTVKIEKIPDGWEYVSYGGKTGFMMKEFLREG